MLSEDDKEATSKREREAVGKRLKEVSTSSNEAGGGLLHMAKGCSALGLVRGQPLRASGSTACGALYSALLAAMDCVRC